MSEGTTNDLAQESVPILAPFWDQMRLGSRAGSQVNYSTEGSAPNRIFIVEYKDMALSGGGDGVVTRITFQIRLHEQCNLIEFYYDNMDPGNTAGWAGGSVTTSASVGIASGKTFISVTPNGSTATTSASKANNNISLGSNSITKGTLYKFTPAGISLSGNTAQGGTTGMVNGDNLLSGKKVQRYLSVPFTPFTMKPYSGCLPAKYTITISGASAAEYTATPNSGILSVGQTLTPTINFRPTNTGVRSAVLTFSDGTVTRTFNLVGEGTTRLTWTGNTTQGGTSGLVTNKDTLLNNSRVDRLIPGFFKPIDIAVAANITAPNAPVTVSIVDSTGLDQYKVMDPNGNPVNSFTFSVPQGTTFSPNLRFLGTGVGYQRGSITVSAEGETRFFILNAYSVAAGGEFYIGSERIGPTSQIFQKDYICVGEAVQSYPVDIKNVGDGFFNITRIDVFQTDSIYAQGVPRYALLRDQNNNPVLIHDYSFSVDPGTAPFTASNATQFPIQIPYLTTGRTYVNFVPQLPGKRFARMFVYTNGANFTGLDPDGNSVDGLLVVDVFGRGLGSFASDENNNTLPKTVTFPQTMIGKTTTKTVSICNTGACDLRIGKKQFRIINGDVKEFSIVDAFGGIAVDANPNNETWVLPPDSCASITFSFTPSRSGSRRVSLQLQTNDSSLVNNNIERGAYYWDLVGVGSIGIETRDIAISPAVIDGATSENPSSSAMAENTTDELVVIKDIVISGADAAEFAMNPLKPWPALPFAIDPGQSVDLSVIHTPATGSQPGPRNAALLLITEGGDTMVVNIAGEAATRTLSAAPASLFDNVTVAVGKVVRQTVMITNTGTTALRLGTTTITGPTATDYTLGRVPRTILAPGQTEYMEVTYRPLNKGTSSAVLTVNSNATNGAVTVQLGGTATKIAGTETPGTGLANRDEVSEAAGVKLWQSRPNPGRDLVEIRYSIAEKGEVKLVLFDERGKQVMMLDEGERELGEHGTIFSVSSLASGTYHYRLVSGGQTLVRTLTVTK
ncbi:MAG: choice-of-anchor D domain-containing protein [Chlorobi bacterium]|nr:choice-of-anchor D domain-containing protein [Chlorobiota bacterium]